MSEGEDGCGHVLRVRVAVRPSVRAGRPAAGTFPWNLRGSARCTGSSGLGDTATSFPAGGGPVRGVSPTSRTVAITSATPRDRTVQRSVRSGRRAMSFADRPRVRRVSAESAPLRNVSVRNGLWLNTVTRRFLAARVARALRGAWPGTYTPSPCHLPYAPAVAECSAQQQCRAPCGAAERPVAGVRSEATGRRAGRPRCAGWWGGAVPPRARTSPTTAGRCSPWAPNSCGTAPIRCGRSATGAPTRCASCRPTPRPGSRSSGSAAPPTTSCAWACWRRAAERCVTSPPGPGATPPSRRWAAG